MYNTLAFYTFVGLVVFFVAVEVYRSKFFIRGVIIEFCSSDLGIEEFILSRMKVQLNNGEVIEAEASSCTMCMGRLMVGDEVSLSKKNERYVVNLPFKIKNNFGNRRNCHG